MVKKVKTIHRGRKNADRDIQIEKNRRHLFQGFFLVVLEKTQGEKNSNSRIFLQKLKQKTQEIGKFDPKRVKKNKHFLRKTHIFLEKLAFFPEKLANFFKKLKKSKSPLTSFETKTTKKTCVSSCIGQPFFVHLAEACEKTRLT